MKRIIIILATLASCSSLLAADPPVQTYTAEVAGIMCSACSAKVQAAFATLEGVTAVKVKKSDKPGVGRVQISSTSAALTKEAAVKALGASASSYHILTFKRSGS